MSTRLVFIFLALGCFCHLTVAKSCGDIGPLCPPGQVCHCEPDGGCFCIPEQVRVKRDEYIVCLEDWYCPPSQPKCKDNLCVRG